MVYLGNHGILKKECLAAVAMNFKGLDLFTERNVGP